MDDFIKSIEEETVQNVLATYEDHMGEGHVSVSAWANGEGFSVEFTGEGGETDRFGMTHTQWTALKRIMSKLSYDDSNEGMIAGMQEQLAALSKQMDKVKNSNPPNPTGFTSSSGDHSPGCDF